MTLDQMRIVAKRRAELALVVRQVNDLQKQIEKLKKEIEHEHIKHTKHP